MAIGGLPIPGGAPSGAGPMGGAPPGPPGGTGPATPMGPMDGSAQTGLAAVKVALEALQKALPSLPMGSDLHNVVLKAVSDISKNMASSQSDPSQMIQQLVQMAQAQRSQPNPAAAMMPGGAKPPMPPPGGGGPPPPMAA